MKVQLHELDLDTELITRAAEFTRRVALLNRNRDRLGREHVPVGLVTDRLDDVYAFRSNVKREKPDYARRFVGTCWQGSTSVSEPTVIWLNHLDVTMPRRSLDVVETFVHELAHAFTRGKHGWTFRRMYALVAPHIFTAFGEVYDFDRVRTLVIRYGRQGDTYRPSADYAYGEWVSSWDRRDEECEKHRDASLRMTKRLTRANVVL